MASPAPASPDPAPWQARVARDLGLADAARIAAATRRQVDEPTRPLLDLLELDPSARPAVQDQVRRRLGEIGREVEDEAFTSWALARGLSRTALDAARRLALEHPGSRLWEAVLASDALDLDDTPSLRRGSFTCEACGLAFDLPSPLVTHLDRCRACGAKSTSSAPRRATGPIPAPGGTIGEYRLVRRLGRGGSSEVWAARRGDDEVALKVFGALDEVGRRRLEREAELLRQLAHPNIVALRGAALDGPAPYLVLELVRGPDLAALASRPGRAGRLTPGEVVHVLEGCARALGHAHERGVLHRDVKPSNVLVDAEGVVKLIDFGVALPEAADRLTVGGVVGTLHYVAPEVLLGGAWAASADLYSLGALAHRLLGGRPIVEAASAAQLIERRLARAPAALEGIPPALATLVSDLLDLEPSRRPTAAALLERLGATGVAPEAASLRADAALELDAPPDAGPRLSPGKVFQNVMIEGEVGRGGMGVVYRARHLVLERPVALKVLAGGAMASPDERRRFLREATNAGALRHPAIVPVLDAGEHEGTCYLVLEFVDGVRLGDWAAARDLRRRLTLFVQVCDALHHAHTRGVIHRDLKPDNIVVKNDAPHVLDFGIAKRIDSPEAVAATAEGALLGTLRYMPPEQAAGRQQEVDVRSDVYALGSILYQLCCGRTPFRGDAREVLHDLLMVEPAPPSAHHAELPWELDAICLRALQKDRDARYQSALELRRDVERFLQGEPISTRPDRALARARRWARRHPLLASALGLSLAALVVLPAGAWATLGARERERRREVEQAAGRAWLLAAQGDPESALAELELARRAIGVDDVLRLPREAVPGLPIEVITGLPIEERYQPRITLDRVAAWSELMRERMRRTAADRLLAEALDALRADRRGEAGEALLAARRIDPAYRTSLADTIAMSNVTAARGFIAAAAARPPEDLAGRDADLDHAAKEVAQALAIDVRFGPAMIVRAELDEARAALDAEQLRAGLLAQARERSAEAVAILDRARERLAAGDVEGARALLGEARFSAAIALASFPDLPEARVTSARAGLLLAGLWLDQGKLELAEQELQSAREHGPPADEVAALERRLERARAQGTLPPR